MKCLLLLHVCVLLLWTRSAFANKDKKITVKERHDEIELICPDGYSFTLPEGRTPTQVLSYKDEKSGEYKCYHHEGSDILYIYVKFRTCDNCIELDASSIAGLAVGDVVATVVVGVAVYLFASVVQSGAAASSNKRPDRQAPRTRQTRGASNDDYQSLAFNSRDHYDELNRQK